MRVSLGFIGDSAGILTRGDGVSLFSGYLEVDGAPHGQPFIVSIRVWI